MIAYALFGLHTSHVDDLHMDSDVPRNMDTEARAITNWKVEAVDPLTRQLLLSGKHEIANCWQLSKIADAHVTANVYEK